ncbi:MAG: SPFH domain-containing protein [Cytophagales bacterium]
MKIFNKLRNEFIDIIDWNDASENTMVYRFPRFQNEIKNGAQLTVRPGQVAVLVNEGNMPADVFVPGRHELSTANIPIMTTLNGWKYGFNSPFKAEVYFFNMKEFINQKWGLKNPIMVDDPRFGFIELRGFGTYAFKFKEPKQFLERFSSTDGEYTTDKINEQLRSLIVLILSDKLAESAIPVEKLAGSMMELSEFCLGLINPIFESDYGLTLTKFYVENLSMPDEIKKEIMDYSRLGRINTDQLAQFNMANALKNQSGGSVGGDMMGMMMGMNIANQMMNNPNNPMNQANQQTASQGPPPLVSFFVAVNGQQTGPFDMNTLTQMAQQGQINAQSLVWKNGMPSWAAASSVSELQSLFGAVPPPLPPSL